MTAQDLILRFPEVPADLHDEPLLAQYAEAFGPFLENAMNPGACSADYSPENLYYLKLVGPFRLYMYGLSTKEKVMAKMQDFLDRHQADPDAFSESLLSADSIV